MHAWTGTIQRMQGLDRFLLLLFICRFPWWPAVIIGSTPLEAAADLQTRGPSSASVSTATDTSSDTHHHQQQQQQPGYVPGSVLVRFLGTYDAAWVEPGKALSRWGVAQHERSSKTKAASFVTALKEATKYLETGACNLHLGLHSTSRVGWLLNAWLGTRWCNRA
jgi:hypothetical protein